MVCMPVHLCRRVSIKALYNFSQLSTKQYVLGDEQYTVSGRLWKGAEARKKPDLAGFMSTNTDQ